MVGVKRVFRVRHQIARVHVADEGFGAVGNPAHGPAGPTCRPQNKYLFRVHGILGPETAAKAWNDDANIFRRAVKTKLRQRVPDRMRFPRRRMKREFTCPGIPGPYIPACLDRSTDTPVLDVPDTGNMRRPREGGIGLRFIPECEPKTDVVGKVRINHGCTGRRRRVDVGDGRERNVADDDLFGGVARFISALGDNHRDNLTDKHYPVCRHGGLRSSYRRVTGWHRRVGADLF